MNDNDTINKTITREKKRKGRPRIAKEKSVVITFRVAPEMAKKIRSLGAASAWIFRDFWEDYFKQHDDSKQQ